MPATSRIRAPYDILCAVIGNPVHHPESGARVAWKVVVDGAAAVLHDHKDDKPLHSTIFEAAHALWTVEANDDEQLAWVCSRIAERVIEAVAKKDGQRTLTADDKAAVNPLLKKGVPLAQAMK